MNQYTGTGKQAVCGADITGRTGITKRMFAFCVLLIVAAICALPDLSYAFQQKDLDKLLATGECKWCDLRKADLSGSKLQGAQLAGAVLSNANLSGADLSGADLSGAVLSGANLTGADLSGAYMRSAYFYGANLSGANLSKTTLDKANLKDAELSGVILSGASLSGTIWRNGSKCLEGSAGECMGDPARRGGTDKGFAF